MQQSEMGTLIQLGCSLLFLNISLFCPFPWSKFGDMQDPDCSLVLCKTAIAKRRSHETIMYICIIPSKIGSKVAALILTTVSSKALSSPFVFENTTETSLKRVENGDFELLKEPMCRVSQDVILYYIYLLCTVM